MNALKVNPMIRKNIGLIGRPHDPMNGNVSKEEFEAELDAFAGFDWRKEYDVVLFPTGPKGWKCVRVGGRE